VAEGTPIGALAVRIGADANDLINAFSKAKKSTDNFASSIKTAAGVVLAAEAAFAAMVVITAKVQDEAGKTAQKVGMAVEEFSALAYAGKLADVSADQLTTGLKQLSKNLAEAQSGTGDVADAFRLLGISVKGADGSMGMTQETFIKIAEKFSKLEDGSAKTALAMKIFGKSGAELIPLLNEGAHGIAEATKEAERFGVIISAEAAKKAQEFNDNLTRLKAAAEGLGMFLATPFVEAIGKASKAMLQAERSSGSWLRAFSEGLFTLLTGDDLHKMNVEITNAADAAMDANKMLNNALQQQKDAGGAGMSPFDDQQVERFRKQVKEAEAELKRLLEKKNQVFPNAQKEENASANTPAPKDKVPGSGFSSKEIEEREKAVRDALHKQRVEDDKRELAQIELTNKTRAEAEATALAQRFELMERFEDLEYEKGQARLERLKGIKDIELSLMTDTELEQKAHEERLARLDIYTEDELTRLGGKNEVIRQMQEQHEEKMRQIEARGINTRTEFEKASMKQKAKTIFGELANITSGVAQNNRAMFELNKAAGISNAVISAYEGISLTMSKYPFPLNIAMAAAHGVAAFAQINAIRSQQFGSGSAPSIAGSTAAPAVSDVGGGNGSGGGSGKGVGQSTVINFVGGDMYSGKQVRQLLEQLNESMADGGRIIFR
jgi:hypothetical protein